MFITNRNLPSNYPGSVNMFGGYNHNKYIADGEFYEMTNMCSDDYPLIRTRDLRSCNLTVKDGYFAPVDDVAFSLVALERDTDVVEFETSTHLPCEYGDRFEVKAVYDDGSVENMKATLTGYNSAGTPVFSQTASGGKETAFNAIDHPNVDHVSVKCRFSLTKTVNAETVYESIQSMSIRKMVKQIRGMVLKNNKLGYMSGYTMFYGDKKYDFSDILHDLGDDGYSDVQVLSYNVYLLVFPIGLYVNILTDEYGYLGSEYNSHKCVVKYQMSNYDGGAIEATTVKPEEPENGQYWIDMTQSSKGLYQWSDALSMWCGVSSTYIKISILDDPEDNKLVSLFDEGDAIYFNSPLEEINNGSVIQKKGEYLNDDGSIRGGWFLIEGFVNGQVIQEATILEPFKVSRKIPKMQYCCVSNNRVWGCYKGLSEDGEKELNEIYASKLGDPKNWYVYEGASTDSYALSIGDDQEFTGAITHDGYPMFFKENIVYKMYGTYPAAYQLYTYNVRGIQPGSARSAAVMNGILFYKTTSDIVAFESGQLTNISRQLGDVKYHGAVAGVCLNKYYVSMLDEDDNRHLFVYDIENRVWVREDDLRIEEFTSDESGELYGRIGLSMYGFGYATDALGQDREDDEKVFKWSVQSGDLAKDRLTKTYFRTLYFRCEAPKKTHIEIRVSVDKKDWVLVGDIYGSDIIKMHEFVMPMERCESFRIKVDGTGECVIHSIGWAIEEGSTKR